MVVPVKPKRRWQVNWWYALVIFDFWVGGVSGERENGTWKTVKTHWILESMSFINYNASPSEIVNSIDVHSSYIE